MTPAEINQSLGHPVIDADGHFIEYNPSAVGWGIFWLRQASTAGARLMTVGGDAPNGVETLVDRLLERLGTLANVKLELHQGVRGLTNRADGTLDIEISTASGDALTAAVLTWHQLPGVLTSPCLGNWPDAAQPARLGPRAEKIQHSERSESLLTIVVT